jgi:imidazolonepropionase-like amidohydrolase
MSVTVFTNGRVFDGVNPELAELSVAVEGERIREVSDRPIRVSGARVIDLGGRVLMPGLIDAHVHAFAIHLNQALTESMPLTLMTAHATHRLRGMIDRGFTTVRDVAGADFGIKEAVASGAIAGPRLFIAGQAISQTGGHGDMRRRTDDRPPCACTSALNVMTRLADGADEVRKAVRDEMRKGADQIKIMVSGGVGSPFDKIDNRQYSVEEVEAAVDEARAWGTYVAAHSYTSKSTQHAVRAGVRTIEHGNLIDDETARIMAEAGAYMVPTLVCYGESYRRGPEFGVSATVMEKLAYVNQAGARMLEICQSAGVKMGYGTDLMGELHDAQSIEFLIRGEVLPPVEVLRSATSINAEILNRAGELGVVAAGALADLIVVDGDPLKDLSLLQDQGRHIPVIMKGGRFHKFALTG